jgi:hypothetical protein
MKRTVLVLAVLFLAAAFGLARSTQTADVKGDWELTTTTPRGERTSAMAIVQDGENIKVTLTSPRGEITGQGTVKGNDIEWTITRTTPRGEMTISYKGKVEGNTMSGDLQMGNAGTGTWKATRKTT